VELDIDWTDRLTLNACQPRMQSGGRAPLDSSTITGNRTVVAYINSSRPFVYELTTDSHSITPRGLATLGRLWKRPLSHTILKSAAGS